MQAAAARPARGQAATPTCQPKFALALQYQQCPSGAGMTRHLGKMPCGPQNACAVPGCFCAKRTMFLVDSM